MKTERIINAADDYWTNLRRAHACILRAKYVRDLLKGYPSNMGIVGSDWMQAAREYLEVCAWFKPLPLP